MLFKGTVEFNFPNLFMTNINTKAYSKTCRVFRMWNSTWKWPEISRKICFLSLESKRMDGFLVCQGL